MFLIVHGAVRNLPISPGSRQYQVWVLHDDDEGWYYWSHYRILHLEVSDSFPFFSQAESYPSSLPGAIAIFLLSLGISRVPSTLPAPVYALLSGLNAAAVGVILLAGVQLARKAITDKLTLPLVLFTACAGICYNALWYFPVLMMTCGIVCWVWELWMKEWVRSGRDWLSSKKWRRRRNATGSGAAVAEEEERHRDMDIELDISNVGVAPPMSKDGESTSSRRSVKAEGSGTSNAPAAAAPMSDLLRHPTKGKLLQARMSRKVSNRKQRHSVLEQASSSSAVSLVSSSSLPSTYPAFLHSRAASFIIIMVLNATLKNPSLELQLFRNMYLAGTIIFGGGPVHLSSSSCIISD